MLNQLSDATNVDPCDLILKRQAVAQKQIGV
jgi:hypothetical protein